MRTGWLPAVERGPFPPRSQLHPRAVGCGTHPAVTGRCYPHLTRCSMAHKYIIRELTSSTRTTDSIKSEIYNQTDLTSTRESLGAGEEWIDGEFAKYQDKEVEQRANRQQRNWRSSPQKRTNNGQRQQRQKICSFGCLEGVTNYTYSVPRTSQTPVTRFFLLRLHRDPQLNGLFYLHLPIQKRLRLRKLLQVEFRLHKSECRKPSRTPQRVVCAHMHVSACMCSSGKQKEGTEAADT